MFLVVDILRQRSCHLETTSGLAAVPYKGFCQITDVAALPPLQLGARHTLGAWPDQPRKARVKALDSE